MPLFWNYGQKYSKTLFLGGGANNKKKSIFSKTSVIITPLFLGPPACTKKAKIFIKYTFSIKL